MLRSLFLGLSTLVVFSGTVRGARMASSDSLLLQEIADSVQASVRNLDVVVEGGRIVRLQMFYHGEKGAVPAALGGLDSLRSLIIRMTEITSLPKEIGRLKRLDSIAMTATYIGPSIPEEIGDLPNLRYLQIAGSKLTTLPASLMKLKKLEKVDFQRNSICRLDDSLKTWLLALTPNALNGQNLAACDPTGIRPRKSMSPRTSPKTGLLFPDARHPLRGMPDRAPALYVSALGRTVWLHQEPVGLGHSDD